jgi:hypothetical protein
LIIRLFSFVLLKLDLNREWVGKPGFFVEESSERE